MKALGLTMLATGALVLLLPIVVALLAFNTYTIGVHIDHPARLMLWLVPCIALIVGGGLLLRRGARTSNFVRSE